MRNDPNKPLGCFYCNTRQKKLEWYKRIKAYVCDKCATELGLMEGTLPKVRKRKVKCGN